MSDAYDIGPRIGIDGEKAFNASLAAIKSNVKNLGSEMKLLTAQFGDNNNSLEAMSAKNEVLRKTITQTEKQLDLQNRRYDEQVRALANLEGAMNKAIAQYGAQSTEAIKAQNAFNSYSAKVNKTAADINQTKASLADMTRELENNANAMERIASDSGKMDKAFSFAGTAAKKILGLKTETDSVAGSMDKARQHSLSFGDAVKAIVTSEAILGGFRMIGDAVNSMIRNFAEFAKEGVATASDLQEVQNVVDVTFGKSAAAVDEFAKKAAGSFGMSELSAKKFTGTMGAMLKSMQLDDDAVTEMSMGIAGLAGDMASFYNLDAEEAFSKLRSGISGETEPLKQLGINMSVANLEAYALSQGINTAWKEMSAAEQATLRYQYIMQATADAQGDFARTSDSYANQQRILQLNMENLSASIGGKVLPVITKFSGLLNDVFAGNLSVEGFASRVGTEVADLITQLSENMPSLLETGTQLIGSVVNGIAQALPNVLEAGEQVLSQLVDGLQSGLPGMVESGMDGLLQLIDAITAALPKVLQTGFDILMTIADGIVQKIPDLIARIPLLISELAKFFTANFPKLVEMGGKLIFQMASGIVQSIPEIINAAGDLVEAVMTYFVQRIKFFVEIGKNIVGGIWDGMKSRWTDMTNWITQKVNGIISTVKGVLGIHSPSKVFAEIGKYSAEGIGVGFSDQIGAVSRQIKSDMGKIIPAAESGVVTARSGVSSVSGASPDMVSAFKEALSGAAVYMDGKRVGSLLTTAQNNTTRARGQSPAMA